MVVPIIPLEFYTAPLKLSSDVAIAAKKRS